MPKGCRLARCLARRSRREMPTQPLLRGLKNNHNWPDPSTSNPISVGSTKWGRYIHLDNPFELFINLFCHPTHANKQSIRTLASRSLEMPESSSQGTITPQLRDSSASNLTEKSSKSQQASCHTCRRQRLRCDAAKPSCQKCLARGVECLGYGAQAILWVQPNAPGKAGNSAGAATLVEPGQQRTAKARKKGRPKLVLMPKVQNESNGSNQVSSRSQSHSQLHRDAKWVVVNNEEARDRMRSLVKRKQTVSSGLTPVGYYNDSLALSMLEYSMTLFLLNEIVHYLTGLTFVVQ